MVLDLYIFRDHSQMRYVQIMKLKIQDASDILQ